MTMLHVKNIRQNLAFATLRESLDMRIEQTPMQYTQLFNSWDKAANIACTRTMPEQANEVEQALIQLSLHSKTPLGEQDAPKAMGMLHRFHGRIAKLAKPGTTPPSYEPEALLTKDFQQFYSLVYHVIPKAERYDGDREALLQTFKAVDIDLLPREDVSKHLDEIIALADKNIGWSRN